MTPTIVFRPHNTWPINNKSRPMDVSHLHHSRKQYGRNPLRKILYIAILLTYFII